MKLAIIATHPIQYHAPWFRLLAAQKNIDLKVYFGFLPDAEEQGVGFGEAFEWDVPLLEGYHWEVLPSVVKKPSLKGFFGNSAPAIFSRLKRHRPDMVILTGWNAWPLLQAYMACWVLRIPMVVRGESNALRKRKWWIKRLHKFYLKRFSAFLCIGRSNRQFYLDYGISGSKLFHCPYFVDNRHFSHRFSECSNQREFLRQQWGIPSDACCFVYVGKLIPKKRVMDLLFALKAALKSAANIQVLIVGSGELLNEANNFVNIHELPVTFTGFLNQTELPKAYAVSDCLVLPSDYGETWGLVVNEAMVCGLPVIVSDRVGCGPDLVQNNTTGFVFPFGDVQALATRMVEIASDDQHRRVMGINARQRIEKYSVENAVEGSLQAIEYVLKR